MTSESFNNATAKTHIVFQQDKQNLLAFVFQRGVAFLICGDMNCLQLNSSSWLVGRGPSLAEVFSEVFAFLMNGHSQRIYSELKSEFKYIFKNIKNCSRL